MSVGKKEQQQKKRITSLPGKGGLPAFIIFLMGLTLILVAAYYLLARGNDEGQMFTFHHLAMDTNIELRLQAENRQEAEALRDAVFDEIERLEGLLSRSLEGSDVYRVNEQAGLAPVQVSPETMEVVIGALEYAEKSRGAFDPTVSPIMDAWGFLGSEYRLPSQVELDEALALVDYSRLQIDEASGTIYLPESGMSIDLGGIAKGYIVDKGLAVLVEAGIKHAFLNAGGDIGLLGTKEDGGPWNIGVRHPRENRNIAVISLTGGAIVTSGDYERTFEEDDVRYHHILDPGTGYPAYSLISVTIVAPDAMIADILSTAVFVMGPEEGMVLIESLPGVDALIVTHDLQILTSGGLDGKFRLAE